MAEYIERSEAIEFIKHNTPNINGETTVKCVIRSLKNVPTADVAEVKHGKWKPCFEDWRKQIEGDECSVCGFQHYGTSIRTYHYCPNCGARMDGEGE